MSRVLGTVLVSVALVVGCAPEGPVEDAAAAPSAATLARLDDLVGAAGLTVVRSATTSTSAVVVVTTSTGVEVGLTLPDPTLGGLEGEFEAARVADGDGVAVLTGQWPGQVPGAVVECTAGATIGVRPVAATDGRTADAVRDVAEALVTAPPCGST